MLFSEPCIKNLLHTTFFMELNCQRCNYTWDYQGESDYYATCPNCKSSVKIPEDQKEK